MGTRFFSLSLWRYFWIPYSQVLSQILPAFSKYDDMKSHFRSIYLSAIFTAVVAL